MKTKLDLDKMSEQELRELNREIVQHLNLRAFVRNKSKLMAFRIGDRVSFECDHSSLEGCITRINQKTASIETDDERSFRVPPSYLSKIVGESIVHERKPNLFVLTNNKNLDRS